MSVAGKVVTPDGISDGWVAVAGSTIAGINTGPAPASAVRGDWIVPGFVDIHCHGGGGGSFTNPEQVDTAITTHRAHGTTTMLASLVTAALPDLRDQIAALAEHVQDGRLAGVHLEGPFLSAARCGAHDPRLLRPPDRDSVASLLAAGSGTVSMVTLAPELEGSLDAVRQLADQGVLAAVGHTDAVLDDVVPAIDAGATVATHLFNGMRPLHHREPGPIGALLDDERVTIELICDLVHLHPTAVRLVTEHAPGRIVLITDAISATAAGDGEYELGPLTVTVRDGEPRLDDGALAGSTLTMDAALRNLVTGCGVPMTSAVHATATRPAELLGMSDRIGTLRPGTDADLVVLDANLHVQHVLHKGTWTR